MSEVSPPRDPAGAEAPPRGLLERSDARLTAFERAQIQFIRKSLLPGALDSSIRFCQRAIGAQWILTATRNLRHIYGLERLPPLSKDKSYVCVANHRSFFDLYVVMAELVARRIVEHRLLFPVRSNFWYDHPLGPIVNGIMSFWAMYPPIFRDPKRKACNEASLDELDWMLKKGGLFLGIHPEGTRNKGDDPYTFLPARSGVGRIVYRTGATVLPVFVNGLGNDLVRQVVSNENGKGTPITVVFGAPIDFGPLLDGPDSPATFRRIAQHSMDVVKKLGEEERGYRAELLASGR